MIRHGLMRTTASSLLLALVLATSACNDFGGGDSLPEPADEETSAPGESAPLQSIAGDPNEVNDATPSAPDLRNGGWFNYRPEGAEQTRWHIFRDDSGQEASDRSRPLPEQTVYLNGRRVRDGRLHLLRHKVNPQMNQVYQQQLREQIEARLVRKIGSLVNADIQSELSPVALIRGAYNEMTGFLREQAPELERRFATRTLTFLVAPWQRVPGSEDRVKYERAQRFSPHQLGFDRRQRTPVRDWAAKHTQMDGDDDRAIRLFRGDFGNLGNQFHHIVDRVIDRGLEDPYSQEPYSVTPPAHPLAFLVQLKIEPGQTKLLLQALMALQPNNLPLDPPEAAPPAKITYAGVPAKVRPTGSIDVSTQYPMMLASFDREVRSEPGTTPIGIEFGTWNGWDASGRKLSLDQSGENWKMTPFLGGGVCVGACSTYYFNLTQSMRIHLRRFKLYPDSGAGLRMEDLETAVEIFDPSNSVLRTALNIPIVRGGVVDRFLPQVLRDANEQIGTAANEKIRTAFQSSVRSTRAQAEKRFPLAVLFLDRAREGGAQ